MKLLKLRESEAVPSPRPAAHLHPNQQGPKVRTPLQVWLPRVCLQGGPGWEVGRGLTPKPGFFCKGMRLLALQGLATLRIKARGQAAGPSSPPSVGRLDRRADPGWGVHHLLPLQSFPHGVAGWTPDFVSSPGRHSL